MIAPGIPIARPHSFQFSRRRSISRRISPSCIAYFPQRRSSFANSQYHQVLRSSLFFTALPPKPLARHYITNRPKAIGHPRTSKNAGSSSPRSGSSSGRRQRYPAEDLAGRGLLLQCLRKFARAGLHLVEQPHVFNRDHRLVSKVVTRSICCWVNGWTLVRVKNRTPIGVPSRNSGTPTVVR